MEEVYAALLLHNAKQQISEESVGKVLQAAGATVEPTKVKALITALEGVNIDEAVKQAAFVAPAAGSEQQEKKEEKKAEEEKKSEEEAAQGLASLFG